MTLTANRNDDDPFWKRGDEILKKDPYAIKKLIGHLQRNLNLSPESNIDEDWAKVMLGSFEKDIYGTELQ